MILRTALLAPCRASAGRCCSARLVRALAHHSRLRVMAAAAARDVRLTDQEKELFGVLRAVVEHACPQTVLRCAGGWVRDKLLGKESHDIDIALSDKKGVEFAEDVNKYLASQAQSALKLPEVPASVLWLLRFPPYGEPRIRAEAAARGVDPGRIIFTDVAAKPVHIRRSGLADVFLDTPLCNAHTTGCDVLWGGCPMVTLPLERMASRVAASLCYATGLGPEMVVASQQEYEERAVELGLDHAKRESLRARLKAARLTCPLFDTVGWVADFERVLQRMWAIHCEGRGPRAFEVSAAGTGA